MELDIGRGNSCDMLDGAMCCGLFSFRGVLPLRFGPVRASGIRETFVLTIYTTTQLLLLLRLGALGVWRLGQGE